MFNGRSKGIFPDAKLLKSHGKADKVPNEFATWFNIHGESLETT